MSTSLNIPGHTPGFPAGSTVTGWNIGARYSLQLSRLPWPTFLFLFFVLMYLCPFDITYSMRVGGPTDGGAGLVQSIEDGNIFRQVASVVIALWSLSVLRSRGVNRLHLNGWTGFFIICSLAWIAVSPLWSFDPSFTVRRIVAVLIFCLGALAVATRLSWREIIAFSLFNSFLILAISVLAELWYGTLLPWQVDYRFSGVMHPNSQGSNCAVLMISAVAYSAITKKRRSILYAIAVLAFVFLVLTKSRTAMAVGVLSAIICLAMVAPRLRHLILSLCFSGVALSVLLIFHSLISDSESLGVVVSVGRQDTENNTLTGRIPLWEYLLGYVEQRPLLGYGYASFWTPERVLDASSDRGWIVGSAHSGYIATAVCLGIPGLILLIAVFATGIYECLKSYGKSRAQGPVFALSILILVFISMFFEEIVDKPLYLSFICFVVLARLAFVRECVKRVKVVSGSINSARRGYL